MWLKYGVALSDELTGIDEVVRGKTQLTCLYCGGGLTAKKGSVKEHHFAHTGETCKPVSQRIKTKAFPALPLYEHFNIELKGEELEQLKVLWKEYGARDYAIPKDLVSFRWQLKGLLESSGDGYAPFLRSYQFTDLGKIPVGALPLASFNSVQEPLLLSELMKLESSVEIALSAGLSCLEERRADLLIYRAQLRRILVNALYFLEVKADGNRVHLTFANTSSGKLIIEISTAQRKDRENTLDIPLRSR
jgi:hypothetical protein